MGGPDRHAFATAEARRAWLKRLQRATQRARDDLGDPSDPITNDLTANLEHFAAFLEQELKGPDHAESDAKGIT
jgi:truncated hemoglobin YjbI